MTLHNQLSFWCVNEQLRQSLPILPLSLIAFESYQCDVRFSYAEMSFRRIPFTFIPECISEPLLYYFYLSKKVWSVRLLLPEALLTNVSVLLLEVRTCNFIHLCPLLKHHHHTFKIWCQKHVLMLILNTKNVGIPVVLFFFFFTIFLSKVWHTRSATFKIHISLKLEWPLIECIPPPRRLKPNPIPNSIAHN